MPGPVSDSYDPEFGTGANADDVSSAIQSVIDQIGDHIGPELKDIVSVVQSRSRGELEIPLTERELRIIRFGLLMALDCI